MSLPEVVKSIVEQIQAESDPAGRSNEGLNCPTEARLLSYFENRLEDEEARVMYQHLASCNLCIEFLAMFSQISEVADEQAEAYARRKLEVTDPELRNLTDAVLAMIDRDEAKFNNSPA